jgi:hypothetical protein
MDEDTDVDTVEDAVPRESDEELTDEQLSDVAGGSVSMSYTKIATTYTQQE